MPLAEALREKLRSVRGIPPDGVFIIEGDDGADVSLLITPTAGRAEDGVPLFSEGFQIKARAPAFAAAEALAWKAYETVEGHIPEDSGLCHLGYPDMTQPPSFIGADGRGRYVFAFNFTYPVTRFDYIK